MSPRQQIEWTDENIATLCALWAEGLSARLIGLRMHISKNAVIGCVDRLRKRGIDLPARPSPIKRAAPKVRMALPENAIAAYRKAGDLA